MVLHALRLYKQIAAKKPLTVILTASGVLLLFAHDMSIETRGDSDYRYDRSRDTNSTPVVLQRHVLSVSDSEGKQHSGGLLLAQNWHDDLSELSTDEDFRIVILLQPPEDTPKITGPTLAWAPSHPVEPSRRVSESAAAYSDEPKPLLALSQRHRDALREGQIFGPISIESPTAFLDSESGEIDLPALATSLLHGLATEPYAAAARIALAAPRTEAVLSLSQIQQAISRLVSKALPAMEKDLPTEALGGAQLLRAGIRQPGAALYAFQRVSQLYATPASFAEAIFLVRAFADQPQVAAEVARMRQFLNYAEAPDSQAEMTLDRRLAWELLGYAGVAVGSYNRPSALAAFEIFQRRYRGDYRNHHHMYWRRTGILNRRLHDVRVQAESLRRLNGLRELGLPVGLQVLARYEALLAQTKACPRPDNPLPGPDDTRCPDCRLSLKDEPAQQEVEDLLHDLDRALKRQMARLSSASVRQILARSDNPRVDQFLKVVQASQISSLAEIMDDALIHYLRRFLLESRIQSTLEPLLDGIEQGQRMTPEDAQRTLRTVNRLLERSTREIRRRQAPPPPEATEETTG